ncbi:hypothetical protein HNQ60_001423 [Povalibacter uvarum]|uniref:Uncharacterized protein n=1 Tax=Povalibacter uvarum TaxID=732238 RepID=A0A841HKK6_9GAMM|nr:hypothetical protein [Povalibacter uvarum]MBB6092545.1 hypothetical protein [Povalibacter uvarum]
MRIVQIATGVALLLSGSLAMAQATCMDTESFDTCWQRLYDAAKGSSDLSGVPAKLAATEMNAARARAATAQTGADSGGTATASTLTDLIPLFDALGLIGNSDQSEGTLAFNLNFLLPVQEADKNMQLQLVVNTSPEPLTQLVEAFPETVRAARNSELQKDIGPFGDSRAELTYSLVNSRFGRDFTVARAQLAPIYEGAWARVGMPMIDGAKLDAQRAALTRLARDPAPAARSVATTTPFGSYPAELNTLRDELKQHAAASASVIGAATLATQNELASLSRLAALVEQQPQLLFSLSHDIRDEVVGPEKTSAKLTFETTRYNLGAFLRGPGAICKSGAVQSGQQEYARCISALNSYVDSTDEALKTQPRWKLGAAYHRVKAINYSYPDDNVALNLPETDRLEVTAGWGRPLQPVKDADRIDIEVGYDSNIDGDTSNKERLKATLTYTRRVGGMDMPFSIVYANKDEFLGEVDHQISLNLGIKFRPPVSAPK